MRSMPGEIFCSSIDDVDNAEVSDACADLWKLMRKREKEREKEEIEWEREERKQWRRKGGRGLKRTLNSQSIYEYHVRDSHRHISCKMHPHPWFHHVREQVWVLLRAGHRNRLDSILYLAEQVLWTALSSIDSCDMCDDLPDVHANISLWNLWDFERREDVFYPLAVG